MKEFEPCVPFPDYQSSFFLPKIIIILIFMFIIPYAFFFFFNKYLFIYFWLPWVFVAAHGLSLAAASGGYSSLWRTGFPLWWLLLLWSTGSRHAGFSSCGTRAQQLWLAGSRAQAQQLRRTGLVAPRRVGSSWTTVRTCVPCIGRPLCHEGSPLYAFYNNVCCQKSLIARIVRFYRMLLNFI